MTSKEIVLQTIEFRNKDQRVPRDLWMLPWTADHFPEQIKKLRQDFTWDISSPTAICTPSPLVKGDPYQVGEYVDDWGSQNDLLIHPDLWDEFFKPMYRDYIQIAHSHGKKMFMHSDGHILRIIPKLIDLGLDVLNSQIFCMGIENLEQFAGKITFWGEIDRQHLLCTGTLEEIDNAVEKVYKTLWKDGGCIAQCEFGPGGKPDNVYRLYEKWTQVRGK